MSLGSAFKSLRNLGPPLCTLGPDTFRFIQLLNHFKLKFILKNHVTGGRRPLHDQRLRPPGNRYHWQLQAFHHIIVD